jgi:hypothetical protein
MVKKKRKPQEPGRCIFCDGLGMSKEHIWSDWIGELILPQPKHKQGFAAFDFDRKTKEFHLQQDMTYAQKRGCLTQRQIRKVCRKCNNEWMSNAVGLAKPLAKKLITGEACKCSESDRSKLVTWLSITTIMQEFVSQPDAVFIPAEHRRLLMDTKRPPDDWSIWIGCYGGSRWRPMSHTHYTALLYGGVLNNTPVPDCRVQIATFTLHNLLVHVFTATAYGVVNEYRKFVLSEKWNLVPVWPSVGGTMTWPRVPVLDPELRTIVTKFGTERLGHRLTGVNLGD